MQAIPDARQQSFEEIYGPPENFLEIEVSFLIDRALKWSKAGLQISLLTESRRPGQKPTDSWHLTEYVYGL